MTIQELKDRIYNDFISSFKNAITPLKKSLFEQISNTLAATFQLVYIYLDRIGLDSFLTTCTESRVVSYFAPLKKITRKEPTVSKGVGTFTGVNGAIIPINTKLTFNELEYQTIEAGTITLGVATLNCESVGTGTLNNTLSNITLTLSVPVTGIDNNVVSTLGFSGATDQESIESVRTRTRQKFGVTTQVDNDSFYQSLANELSNVKASFISNIKNGVGTFGVTILTFTNDGVPIQSDIDEVEQYFIDNEAVPDYVTAEYFIPTITPQALTIQLAADNEENRIAVQQLATDYLYLVQKPSTTFKFQGLADTLQTLGARLTVPAPTTDYIQADDEVLDLGVITWI